MRIYSSSAALAIAGCLMVATSSGLDAQGARQRGTASTEGRAVPRAEGRREGREQAPPAAQAQPQRTPEPARSQSLPAPPPARRLDFGQSNTNAVAVPREIPRVVMPQVVVPQVIQPRVETVRPYDHPAYRPDYRPNYRPPYQPNFRTLYRPDYRRSYRPYYTFLPRVRLGFGLWIGYPVSYPTYFYPSSYPYVYPYPYPYPTASPYPGYSATATVGAAGGLSFEITPDGAEVYVDGIYFGVVGQFTPNQPPLSLAPGRHHVEIREPGFEVIAFDVDILPGQVIPYRGELRRF